MLVDDPAHMAKLHLLTHTGINSALAMSGEDGSGNWPTQAVELGLGPYAQGFPQVWVPTAKSKGAVCRVLLCCQECS